MDLIPLPLRYVASKLSLFPGNSNRHVIGKFPENHLHFANRGTTLHSSRITISRFQSLSSGARIVSPRLLLAASLLLLPTLFSQAQGVPVIQVETHLIDTTLSVIDANGHVVTGLTRGDFTVVEDGVRQKIRFFAHDNQLPLSIDVVIDA